MLDDEMIVTLDTRALLSRNFVEDIYDIADKPERERIKALCMVRAKELNMETEFKSVIAAYNTADKKLAEQYQKEYAKMNSKIDLKFDGNGKALTTVDNFLSVLQNDRKFKGLKFNLLTYSPEKEENGTTERWTDADDAFTRYYIEKKYKFHSAQKCDDALRIIFAQNEYHPIRNIIDRLEWDGVPRICNFLHKWTKCDDTAYTREVSRLIFAGGIHRLYNSGCKFDDMPVLIGTKQGEGKSTLVRWLALKDDYFTEVTEIEGQKGMEAIEGAWICEMGELLALTKAREVEGVKSYLTRQVDRYRRPFDRRVTDHKRQCIFIGTTNKEQFLTDKTGNRRFYPVKVYQSGYELFDKKDEVKAYIKQCWAEAKTLYDEGKLQPYAKKELIDVIRENQSQAVEEDWRKGVIQDFLTAKQEVCAAQIWKYGLHMDKEMNRRDSMDIGLIMQNFPEWHKTATTKRFPDFGSQRYWVRVSPKLAELANTARELSAD